MQLFEVNGVDLTKHITVPSYVMNRKDVYKEWEDADHITHRNIFRSRIEGKFTLKFREKDVYYNFLELIKNNKTAEGYIPVLLYVNNLHEVVSANVFLEFSPANTVPLFKRGTYSGFEVKVVER